MKINVCHGSYNLSNPRGTSIKYFVVHYTGTMASAENNCKYFAGGNRNASADYFIDRDGSVWEYNDPLSGDYSWHCGDGYGRNGITNQNAVGVECVSNGVDFTDAQIASLQELYHELCNRLGYALEVVRHYDASGKSCPAPYISNQKWNTLKGQIMASSTGWKKDDKGWWYQEAAGYPVNAWREIDGYWYYFGSSGYALTGWQYIKGEWYYLTPHKQGATPECAMVTGWLKDSGAWYYLTDSGAMVKNCTMEIDGETYAFNKSGVMFEISVPVGANGALVLD